MKNLFSKSPIFHYTFVLTIISLVCGLLIGGINAVTAPVIERNLLKAKVESYESVLKNIDSFDEIDVTNDYPTSIKSVVKGKDASGKVLGYIYEAYGTNSYGSMTIIGSVDEDGVFLGLQFLTIEQTLGVDFTRTNLSYYVGANIDQITPSNDLISGATGSLSTFQGLLSDIASAHRLSMGEIEVDPLELIYGSGYALEIDAGFTPTAHIIQKRNVKVGNDVVGYVYDLQGEGEYFNATDSIVLEVYFNQDDEIVEIYLPEDTYNHSSGNFRNRIVNYVKVYIGLTLDDLTAAVDGALGNDIAAGSSNSKALVDTLLKALVNEVE